jgi:hypothetical protein
MALQDYKMAAWQKPETHRNLNDITSICIIIWNIVENGVKFHNPNSYVVGWNNIVMQQYTT